jgi:nucleotide-binding universal stress UspA family protein
MVKKAAAGKLEELAEAFASVPTTTMVEVGAAAATVVDVARNEAVDQIVIGSHSRHGLARVVLGSVAERVARTAPCPVTIVPASVQG